MDLVITSDTAIAHLSATLEKKTWIALPFVADWRWFTNKKDSQGYSNVTRYRQEKIGKWEEIFHFIGEDLKKEFLNK